MIPSQPEFGRCGEDPGPMVTRIISGTAVTSALPTPVSTINVMADGRDEL